MKEQCEALWGLRVGSLRAEEHVPNRGTWIWRCDCGRTTTQRLTKLLDRGQTACTRCRKPRVFKNLAGQKFQMLTAVAPKKGSRFGEWWFDCDCGNRTAYVACRVVVGDMHSCGCQRRAIQAAKAVANHQAGVYAAARAEARQRKNTALSSLFTPPRQIRAGNRWNRSVVIDGTVIRGAKQASKKVQEIRRNRDVEAA